ncbi:hypothetical protein LCM10_18125 [Rossellomorea aquimaris]|uniref:hypothetical protein n=1 Tax=Rossellomorea aquimaris TaxID=189382 RepID=UPI001CD74FA8|nr:hypothetical protein [Rossellomorea aquimaris]MCA1056886.1 hypothetical protein [Rossellomorea aquimaris]
MKESKRERYIRFLLILSCLFVVVIGYVLSSPEETEDAPLMSAQVLKQQDKNQNAVVAVSKNSGNRPILVIYEVEKEREYHFSALHSVALKEQIQEMKINADGDGLWVRIGQERWVLFSNELEVQKNKGEPSFTHSTRQSFQYEETSKSVIIDDGHRMTLDLSGKVKPLEIHRLSANGSLWLIVYKDDVVLAKSR